MSNLKEGMLQKQWAQQGQGRQRAWLHSTNIYRACECQTLFEALRLPLGNKTVGQVPPPLQASDGRQPSGSSSQPF